uniref:Uncharacterized protein n=1 Tax=Anguilla anguilla TaxID=7936 RepID=A0A0E9WU02_ANGAN
MVKACSYKTFTLLFGSTCKNGERNLRKTWPISFGIFMNSPTSIAQSQMWV